MSLPKYYELYAPILESIADGNTYVVNDVKKMVSQALELTDNELEERLNSGRTVFDNRIGWAKTYLKKAGLICIPQKSKIQITEEGKKLWKSGVKITNKLLAETYPTFAEFQGRSKVKEIVTEHEKIEEAETPQETFERMYRTINGELSEELLAEIMNQSPSFFENLVVDLMKSMGYGDGFVTKASGDDGIDGVIHEDKLGFNLIYIQAKRWNPANMVGKPEIQKFAGAMMGPPRIEKGLFITTAKFTQGARTFANAQHIILVDGQKLTELMIENNLGVSTQKTYCLKRIDSDYFSEN